MSHWHDVGSAEEFVEDEPRAVEVAGLPIAVVRVGEELFALHDLCTHERVPLSEGFVEDGYIECPLHQGLFDLRTGQPRKAPCVTPVQTYPVQVKDGRVQILVLPSVAASS